MSNETKNHEFRQATLEFNLVLNTAQGVGC